VLTVGLTGGIGAGKSTVAARLSQLGAVVIDADALAREVVARGTPGLAAVARRFGPEMLTSDGALDRARLAAVVFSDDESRLALEAILHPLIGAARHQRMARVADDAIVVHDVPLLVETGGMADYDAVVVVQAPVETRRRRLVNRGLSLADADARIAAQASDEARQAVATFLILNDSTPAELDARVDRIWQQLLDRRSGPAEERPRSGDHA
jgi:dephospho-CoA kinase